MIRNAYDKNGNLVTAGCHFPGPDENMEYFCPVCGVPLHETHRHFTCFFACYPGNPHQDPECAAVNASKKAPKTEMMKVADVMKYIIGPVNHGGGKGTAEKAKVTHTGTTPDGFAPHSLKGISLSGASHKPLGTRITGGYLTDLLISHRSYTILDHGGPLGFRVIECRADFAFDTTKTIRFVCYRPAEAKEKSGNKYIRNYFFFQFRNGDVDYDKLKEKLFMEEGGKLVARHRAVLIAAIWRRCRVSPGERQHYRGECVNERCFFIPDAPQNLTDYTPEK